MLRPRWHDALIVAAILALFAVGVWALWGDDVRALLGAPAEEATPAPSPQT